MSPRRGEVFDNLVTGDRFVELASTTFGLARDGRVDRRGLPGPLQLAVRRFPERRPASCRTGGG
jgi:hypothetical protein